MTRASSIGLGSLAMLAACAPQGGDPSKQYGANPNLPEPQQYLLPPMSVPRSSAGRPGETPTVPRGLQIEAMATGLEHPRNVYPLPNGDILVVESQRAAPSRSSGPRTVMTGSRSMARGRRRARKGGNRITLLRDANGDGKPELQSVFLDHLNSPFGVALVGDDALRRQHRRDHALSLHARRDEDHRAGQSSSTDLPGGPIDHHWTKSLMASPDGSKLYVGVGSNSNITENGIGGGEEPRRDLGGGPRDRRLAHLRERAAQPERPDLRAAERRAVGGRQRARRARARPRARTT